MIKRILATLAICTGLTPPLQAMSSYVDSIAQATCQYMAQGASWKKSLKQAYVDNAQMIDEWERDGDAGTYAVVDAVEQKCPDLFAKAARDAVRAFEQEDGCRITQQDVRTLQFYGKPINKRGQKTCGSKTLPCSIYISIS